MSVCPLSEWGICCDLALHDGPEDISDEDIEINLRPLVRSENSLKAWNEQ
jgi:hypothetical protein